MAVMLRHDRVEEAVRAVMLRLGTPSWYLPVLGVDLFVLEVLAELDIPVQSPKYFEEGSSQ